MADFGSGECRVLDQTGDAALVQSLLDSDPSYIRRVRGDSPAIGDGHEILVGKPGGLAFEDKFVLGVVQDDVLLAIADVLRGWPKPDTAHLGLLFVSGSHRGQGLAHRLHDEVVQRAISWPRVVSWVRGSGGVLAPHMTTPGAPVAADADQQRRGSPAERFMRQLPGDSVPSGALASAPVAPIVGFGDPARQHRPAGFKSLTHHTQAKPVQASEGRQVRGREGNVNHVEVLWMGSVRTPIIEGPRPLPPR